MKSILTHQGFQKALLGIENMTKTMSFEEKQEQDQKVLSIIQLLVAYDPRRHQDTIPRRRRSPFARADLSAYLYFVIMNF